MLVKAHQKDALTKEFLNWSFMLLAAAILSLLIGRAADGARPIADDIVPAPLPAIEEVANPMSPMTPSAPMEDPLEGTDLGLILNLWNALELQRSGEIDEAISAWEKFVLPCETEVWRSAALAAAHLRTGDVEPAEIVLNEALQMEPDNAVLHYYMAIALLHKSIDAPEWYDATPEPRTRFASYTPEKATRTSTLYQLRAMSEFEKAIEFAKGVIPEQPLVPPIVFAHVPVVEPIGTGVANPMFETPADAASYESAYLQPMPIEPPTVADLLEAIGANNFEGKAHNMLAPLYLAHGLLQQAEEHMNQAVSMEMNVLDGYRQLADRYEARERYGDAFRANLKAMGRAEGVVQPARKAFGALHKSLPQPW